MTHEPTRNSSQSIADEATLLRSLANDAPLLFVALRQDGTIDYVSDSVELVLGGTPADYLGRNVVDLLHPDDVERAILQLATTTVTGTAPGITRFKVRHADGSWKDLEIFGSLVNDGRNEFLGIYARDGQNQIFLEDLLSLLLSGADRIEALSPVLNTVQWHGAASHVAITYIEDGELSRLSTGLPDGLAGSAALDSPWGRCRSTMGTVEGSAADLDPELAALAASAKVDRFWIEPVDWGPRQQPATVTIWTATDSPFGPENHSYGMGAARYLTELVLRWTQQAKDLDRATRQLVAQEKLTSLGTLTTGVAHEVRNPLSFVKNFTEAGIETVGDVRELISATDVDTDQLALLVSELSDSLEMVAKHAERIDVVVRNMLGHSQGSGHLEEADVADLLRSFVELGYQGYRGAGHSDFHAQILIEAPPVTAMVRPHEIGRVIINLVTNACAAMDELSRHGVERDAILAANLSEVSGEVVITVTDNGIGIGPEVMEKVFDPFFTTKAPGEGTGLGLGLCHDIVTGLHGGRMTVASEPGVSTTFEVALPLRPSST